MKHKKILVVLIVVVAIIVSFISIKNIKLNNAAEIEVSEWEEDNNYSIERFTRNGHTITAYWDEFGRMSTSEMLRVADSCRSFDEFRLEYIISDGQRYFLNPYYHNEVQLNDVYGKTIAYRSSSSSSYSSSSSSSNSSGKTATCNYCHGTGKVNGDTCPWCNGSGKTYDNAFNDLLGD